MATDDRDGYFAAAPSEEIGERIVSKLKRLSDTDVTPHVQRRRELWRRSYAHHYGFDLDGAATYEIRRGGEQGELAVMRVNRARAVAKALLGLLLSQRMTWKPSARNGDLGARDVVAEASNTLEYLWRTERLQGVVHDWAELSVIVAEALCFPEFDPTRGEAMAVDEAGQPVFGGELRFNVVPPWRFRFDEEVKAWEDVQWVAVGVPRNKWDYLALYPRTVTGGVTKDELDNSVNLWALDSIDGVSASTQRGDSDQLMVTRLFHRVSPSMPQGRYVELLGANCVVVDESLEDWPLVRLTADEQHETAHGYTSHWDVLGVQDMMDHVESAIATNLGGFAEPAVAMEADDVPGKNVSRVRGMKILHVKKGGMKPEVVQLLQIPKEAFDARDGYVQAQRDLTGLNDVQMGQPDTAQMNAEAFTLLAGMAQQRNSPQMQRLVDAVGELGTVTLKLVSKHWPPEKQILISGEDVEPRYETVHAESLGSIEKVIVEVGNPLEQTAGYRMQLGQMIQNSPSPEAARQVQQIAETGRLEPVTDPLRSASEYMDAENDALKNGKPAVAHWSDDHVAHVQRHKCVIDDNQVRGNPAAIDATDAHISEHYALYFGLPPGMDPQTDPQWAVRIRMMLGQSPPPDLAPPMGPPPGAPPPMEGPPSAPADVPPPNGAPPAIA